MEYITNPKIEEYLRLLTKVDDPVLLKMEKLGHKLNFPIVDRLVGNFLYIFTKIKRPKLIVELGSGFGYSAYWFAKGLEDGKVVLNDYQENNIKLAKDFFKRGNLIEKAVFEVGDAVENAKRYKNIDILFLDHEKTRYLEAIKVLKGNLSEYGVVIADNVLWHGNVIEKEKDKKTEKILEFNEYMHQNFETSILPIRDGLLIGIKK